MLILTALWVVRVATIWMQGRLSQHAATAAITGISGDVLRAVTALPSNVMAGRRDAAAVLVTSGLDGLRPYFVSYLPPCSSPGSSAGNSCGDRRQRPSVGRHRADSATADSSVHGVDRPATAERSAAALGALTTLQTRLMDLVAGVPTLRALGRADGAAGIADPAAHRRSTMATLRIAFLSALVLELIATLGVALVAVSIGLRLVFGR